MTYRTRLAVRLLEGRERAKRTGLPGHWRSGNARPCRRRRGQARARTSAPVITNFKAVVGPNGQVTFTGRVSDDTAVAGYVVRITGPGVDTSAIVERDGTFRVTTTVAGFTAITVSATTTDSGGLGSSPVYTTFTPIP